MSDIAKKLMGVSKYEPPTVSYNNNYSFIWNGGTSQSYSGISTGTASSDRFVVVGVYLGVGATASSIVGISIAGITATIIESTYVSGRNIAAAYALVPTGTSATVTVTTATTVSGNYIYLTSYSVFNAKQYGLFDSALTNYATNVDSLVSATVTTPPKSVVIGFYGVAAVASSGDTATWTGLNRDFTLYPFADTVVISSASIENTTGTDLTATVRVSDTLVNRPSLILSSWR